MAMQEIVNEVQFPQNMLKNLVDKNEERRQSACKQLEIIISKNADKKKIQQIQKIIYYFRDKYVKTNDNSKKKVGLDALTSIMMGIKQFTQSTSKFTPIIVNIILESLNDPEHKIRYTALKALYYISKALDDKILCMFNQIFENIIGKMTDLDEQVKRAAEFLDSALQTILNSALSTHENCKQFDLKGFMAILTSKMKSMNPTIRQYLIKWINNLNQLPTIQILVYLPDILEDLMFMLGDKQKQLQKAAQTCLKHLERQLDEKFNQNKLQIILSETVINNILSILIKVAKGKSSDYSKLNSLAWFKLLFYFFKTQIQQANNFNLKQKPNSATSINPKKAILKKIIIERFDQVLQPILMLMSHQLQEIRKLSMSTNDLLMQNIQMINKEQTINFGKVMPLLKQMLSQKKSSSTSETVLRWMKFLLENYNDKILPQINDIIEKLVEKLCDSNTKNVISIIQSTTVTQQYFQLLIQKMLGILFTNKSYEDKPQMILKRFCSVLDSQRFCRSLCSQIITTFNDKMFMFQIMNSLIYLIITDKNMLKVRRKLQDSNQKQSVSLFMTLFQAFKYNPSAATSLCLLSQQYQLAYRIILTFGNEREVTNNVLIGFCKIVTLLQSPGFLFLRLQLLQKENYPYLVDCLSALLMLLPQGKIYNMLKSRIQICKFVSTKKKPLIIQQQILEKKEIISLENCLIDFNNTFL